MAKEQIDRQTAILKKKYYILECACELDELDEKIDTTLTHLSFKY